MIVRYFAKDRAGNYETLKSNQYATTYILNLTLSGNGAGTISSTPPKVFFGATGSTSIIAGAPLNLHAQQNDFSQFSGWSGDCAGSGDCMLQLPVETLKTSKNATASFSMDVSKSVLIGPPNGQSFFSSPQKAYLQVKNRESIAMWAVSFNGDFVADSPVSATLQGGWGHDFSKVIGQTTLNGKLTIGKGSLVLENLIIR
jgi:hypothetical protein